MKKAITILSICLFTIIGAQTTQAQTKEETITWIKEKLAHINNSSETPLYSGSVEISPCAIQFSDKFNKYTIHLSADTKWVASNNTLGSIETNNRSEVITAVNLKTYKVEFSQSWFGFCSSGCDYREPNLEERLAKAFNHLSSFCGKNEAF